MLRRGSFRRFLGGHGMARKEVFQDKTYIPKCQRRDHEIYEMCRVRGRTQREAADKYGISQARVSKVIRRVTEFHSLIDPTERGLSREQRARAALRLHEQRLDYAIGIRAFGTTVPLVPLVPPVPKVP
jgi:hypothetical protein